MRTALLPAVFATTVTLGMFAVSYADAPRSGGRAVTATPAENLRVGAVCSSRFAFATDVSCGLLDFGDVRFHCSAPHDVLCPRTRSVTLENVGRRPVTLVAVSGSAPGQRHETVSRTLPSGARQVLAPRADDTYLYDILLRADTGLAAVGVIGIS
ncbi:hypothetical protein [Streptomyces sp. NPDC001070]